ncbi:MAG: acetolactate decarboxylase [Bacteroidia bacterium]|nr:acetolactate decarboxylase [Bacteroidia bacterium]
MTGSPSKSFILALCLFSLAACNQAESDSAEKETMFQVATLQSLMVGNYDGFVSIGELKRHGDVGLGTFERVNGEMIVLDGHVYQALGDGSVRIADDGDTTPFSTVTWFEADITDELNPFENVSALERQLDSIVYGNGRNFIYALRLDIDACDVTFRSELPMEKPYGPLSEVLPDKQRSFSCRNTGGTVVAVYFPSFFSGQNTPGWHFHFISSDRSQGGHMLEISSIGKSTARLDATPYFNLYLPAENTFSRRDLSGDMSEDIEKVEHSN